MRLKVLINTTTAVGFLLLFLLQGYKIAEYFNFRMEFSKEFTATSKIGDNVAKEMSVEESNKDPNKAQDVRNRKMGQLITLLNDLTNTINLKVSERKVYGNIYSERNTVQVEGYLNAVREFQLRHSVKNICEIGFAGGHSATLLLYATGAVNYIGFDEWNRPFYENAALQWVSEKFQKSNIVIIKGDSTKSVTKYDGKCDVIHIDGGHQGNVPLTDMINMARLASKHNLLLLDDCTKSFPAVLRGVNILKKRNLVSDIQQHDAGWAHRGFRKGWCVGRYITNPGTKEEVYDNKATEAYNGPLSFPERNKISSSSSPPKVTIIVMGYSPKRLQNYEIFLSAYVLIRFVEQIILIWNNRNVSFPKKLLHPKIQLLTPEVNSMNNRFNTSRYVTTDAVLIIDDDVMISDQLLAAMLLAWDKNRQRLVGLSNAERYVSKSNEYAFHGKNPSIAIGKNILFDKHYLDKYMQDKELVEKNRNLFTCDDISLNGLIYKETKLLPVFVQVTKTKFIKYLNEVDGVSITYTNWKSHRTDCVRWVSNHFNIQWN